MQHKAEYSVTALSNRLKELQPNFYVTIRKTSELPELNKVQLNLPTIYLMNDRKNETYFGFN